MCETRSSTKKNTASTENVEHKLANLLFALACQKGEKVLMDKNALLTSVATSGGGLIRRAALYIGDTRLGAAVPEPFT